MSWSSEWKTPPVWPQPKEGEKVTITVLESFNPENNVLEVVNRTGKEIAEAQAKAGGPIPWPSEQIKELAKLDNSIKMPTGSYKVEHNLQPTHDPYTNPNCYLYYECQCGARLDPHTKRFAELNNKASEAGWKIRWGANSYVPYCAECGKGIE